MLRFTGLLLIAMVGLTACSKKELPATRPVSIIPKPIEIVEKKGSFVLPGKAVIAITAGDAAVKTTAGYLAGILSASTGSDIGIKDKNGLDEPGAINLELADLPDLGNEGYELDCDSAGIRIRANKANGLFYGVQTLLQLFDPAVYAKEKQKKIWVIPAVSIKDKPRFSYRGMHLDVSRHFFPKEFIKKYIDLIALHKMNVFHWHLTDDNGWRIEIKKYPELTNTGAWRVDREDQPWSNRKPPAEGEKATYGGFYTQDEIREIIDYAAKRFITIIPEIEMPGHSCEVFAAYPEYSCAGKKLYVQPGGYWPNTDIFCAGNEETFKFLEDILSEVADLFPSEYIHIGGDEADKTAWKSCKKCQQRIKDEKLKDENELQSYFIQRIEKVLTAKNKKLIGWDEILEGGLAPEATVMSWRGMEGGIEAARMKHNVIMTPVSHCYFDYYQADPEFQPLAIGGYIPVKMVYSFEPVPQELTEDESQYILGAQGNVWTEYIATPGHAEYMAVSRMSALAEVNWTDKSLKNWEDFSKRIRTHFERLDALGVNYCKGSYKVEMVPSYDTVLKELTFTLASEIYGAEIHYTTDGSEPAAKSPVYKSPLAVKEDMTLAAVIVQDGKIMEKPDKVQVSMHKGIAKVSSMAVRPNMRYSGNGMMTLCDGISGTKNHRDGKWLGFSGDDPDLMIDLGQVQTLSSAQISFIQNTNAWIFLPKDIEILASGDGKRFLPFGSQHNIETTQKDTVYVQTFTLPLKKEPIRYLRVKINNRGQCPPWHAYAGENCWVFVDEIVLR